MTLDTSPLTHPNASGNRKANTAAAITYVDECEAIHALTFFTVSFISMKRMLLFLTDGKSIHYF